MAEYLGNAEQYTEGKNNSTTGQHYCSLRARTHPPFLGDPVRVGTHTDQAIF